jgi:hypothetical protein
MGEQATNDDLAQPGPVEAARATIGARTRRRHRGRSATGTRSEQHGALARAKGGPMTTPTRG